MKYNNMPSLLFCFIFLIANVGCEKQDEIQIVTKKFLMGYYAYDFKSIYDISSSETLSKLKDIESRTGELMGSIEVDTSQVIIHEYYIDGDHAYCRYTIKQDKDDTNAMSENLKLIKKDNKWLVVY